MKTSWLRKAPRGERPTAEGPLNAKALARLRAQDSATLLVWIDNSLAKIGARVAASQRSGTPPELLEEALAEAQGLVQAIRELGLRKDQP